MANNFVIHPLTEWGTGHMVTRPKSKCPCEVLAHYPAPIQVTWIGHPTTTGDRCEQRFLISTLLFLMSKNLCNMCSWLSYSVTLVWNGLLLPTYHQAWIACTIASSILSQTPQTQRNGIARNFGNYIPLMMLQPIQTDMRLRITIRITNFRITDCNSVNFCKKVSMEM